MDALRPRSPRNLSLEVAAEVRVGDYLCAEPYEPCWNVATYRHPASPDLDPYGPYMLVCSDCRVPSSDVAWAALKPEENHAR